MITRMTFGRDDSEFSTDGQWHHALQIQHDGRVYTVQFTESDAHDIVRELQRMLAECAEQRMKIRAEEQFHALRADAIKLTRQ